MTRFMLGLLPMGRHEAGLAPRSSTAFNGIPWLGARPALAIQPVTRHQFWDRTNTADLLHTSQPGPADRYCGAA